MGTRTPPVSRIDDIGAIRLRLASPEEIRGWSHGEVKTAEMIDHSTFRPREGGLFCPRIFGASRVWRCRCGRTRGRRFAGDFCERCHVRVARRRSLRRHMGHVELFAPVVHPWSLLRWAKPLGTLLGMKVDALRRVIYYQDYVVFDPGDTPLEGHQTLGQEDYRDARERFGDRFRAGIGAEGLRELLVRTDPVGLSDRLRREIGETASGPARGRLIRRLKVVEAMRDSGNRPGWAILECLPVVPPGVRPLVRLGAGRFAIGDLNVLYRRVIRRNDRVRKLTALEAPAVILDNEKRMLQQAVDALFENGCLARPVCDSSGERPLRSLKAVMLRSPIWKALREGKRVDYSARSAVVPGPELRLDQCGLPKPIALTLFRPFLIRGLVEGGFARSVWSAAKALERGLADGEGAIWDVLARVMRGHPVLLSCPPMLRRTGIQAFEPVLVEGNAIRIPPLAAEGFDIEFDGAQASVHLPLSIQAQVEAAMLLMPGRNLHDPVGGALAICPTSDIVLGLYDLTMEWGGEPGEGMTFADPDEVFLALDLGKVGVHARIRLRLPKGKTLPGGSRDEAIPAGRVVATTAGRVVFNDILPLDMPFYNEAMRVESLQRVVARCDRRLGHRETVALLDALKELGLRRATRSGLSLGIEDLAIPASKAAILAEAEKKVDQANKQCRLGNIGERERFNQFFNAWTNARQQVSSRLAEGLTADLVAGRGAINPLFVMIKSGARGNFDRLRDLAGMRGLIILPSDRIAEVPGRSNFREGLSMPEFYLSSLGNQKEKCRTASRRHDAARLAIRLVRTAGEVIVTVPDCGTTRGVTKGGPATGDPRVGDFARSVAGRVSLGRVVDPSTDEVVVREGELISTATARRLETMGIDRLSVRSPTRCEADRGVCSLCYGADPSTGRLVEPGTAVGLIAALAIGGLSDELTTWTFRFCSPPYKSNVEEGYQKSVREGSARFDRLTSVDVAGVGRVVTSQGGAITIIDRRGRELECHEVPYGATLQIEDGQAIEWRQILSRWDPHSVPILARADGRVRYADVVEGETMRAERPASGPARRSIIEHGGGRHPRILLDGADHEVSGFSYLPVGTHIDVDEGAAVREGMTLARMPRPDGLTDYGSRGLPLLTELFEDRPDPWRAVLAEIDGRVEHLKESRQGRRVFVVRDGSGHEREHLVSQGRLIRVSNGDEIRAGDPLCVGPTSPRDLLRILGEEATVRHLLREATRIFRENRIDIDEKHFEIIVTRMLCKVRVESAGDTGLRPGMMLSKFEFRALTRRLVGHVKVRDPGDTGLHRGEIVPRERLDAEVLRARQAGGREATWTLPEPAVVRPQLRGIIRAAEPSDGFLSSAISQGVSCALARAALAGRVENLLGLRENVLLGRLIPVGTGFPPYREARVRAGPPERGELETL